MAREVILSVKDLNVKFRLRGRELHAIRNVSLDVYKGESLAIVGESGSGKSVFTKTFMGLLDANGYIPSGEILYNGRDLAKLRREKDEAGGRMAMKEVEGSEQSLPAEIVLIAAGFLGSQKYVTDAFKVAVNQRTNVDTAPGGYETSVKNVFTAGDMHRGQSLVVWAIREGREAAKAVDESLMGYTNLMVQ